MPGFSYIFRMNLNEFEINLISFLSDHVLGSTQLKKSDAGTIRCLMTQFPDYAFSGIAYRAIEGEWSEFHDNICWSFNPEMAIRGCLDGKAVGYDCEIYLYWADVCGFDLSRFLKDMKPITDVSGLPELIHKNAVAISQAEQEVLVVDFNGLTFSEKSTRNE